MENDLKNIVNEDDLKNLSLEELIDRLQIKLLTAEDPAEKKSYLDAICELRRVQYEERIALENLDSQKDIHKDELKEKKKDRKAMLINGLIAAAIGGGCTLAVPVIKGKVEKSYLGAYVGYETQNDVLINQNKKRMPRS